MWDQFLIQHCDCGLIFNATRRKSKKEDRFELRSVRNRLRERNFNESLDVGLKRCLLMAVCVGLGGTLERVTRSPLSLCI